MTLYCNHDFPYRATGPVFFVKENFVNLGDPPHVGIGTEKGRLKINITPAPGFVPELGTTEWTTSGKPTLDITVQLHQSNTTVDPQKSVHQKTIWVDEPPRSIGDFVLNVHVGPPGQVKLLASVNASFTVPAQKS